jgi:hypothetical protein
VNFIRTCCLQLVTDQSDALQQAGLSSDGSWDAEDLRQAVVEHRVEDPWSDYQQLIAIEIDVLREHIGDARALELQRQVEKVDAPGAPIA